MNRLYKVIEEDPALNRDIKIIGIAVANKPNQIKVYKKQFRVPFPVFADPKGLTWQILGKPGTPTMIVSDRSGKVLTVHGGVIEDLDHFLAELRDLHKKE